MTREAAFKWAIDYSRLYRTEAIVFREPQGSFQAMALPSEPLKPSLGEVVATFMNGKRM